MTNNNLRMVGVALAASCTLGFLAARKLILKNRFSPNTILAKIRHQFSHDAVVRDAWIDKQKQPYTTAQTTTSVYRGGFSRIEDNALVPYEFAVDCNDGTIVDLKRITFN